MKRFVSVLALAIGFALVSHAQTPAPTAQTYTWAAVPTGNAGQLGNYIALTGLNAPRPSIHTVDVTVSGTTPSVCTFRVEGSADASAWYGLDTTSPTTTSCTASFMESIVNRPVQFLRIFVTFTQGDATTSVIFHWTGGRP